MAKKNKRVDFSVLYGMAFLVLGVLMGVFFAFTNLESKKPVYLNQDPYQSIVEGSWDIDKNGIIDISDIGPIIDNYGKSASIKPVLDVNNDGVIDIVDIGIVTDHSTF